MEKVGIDEILNVLATHINLIDNLTQISEKLTAKVVDLECKVLLLENKVRNQQVMEASNRKRAEHPSETL